MRRKSARFVVKRGCEAVIADFERWKQPEAALIGHSKPKTSRIKARISQALSARAVANSWWSPSSLPAWLNEEFYVQKIQPQLRTLKV